MDRAPDRYRAALDRDASPCRESVTLAELNALDRGAFVAALGGVFEHSPWVAEAVWPQRPFATVEALHAAMVEAVFDAPEEAALALICAHPELAGKAAVRGELTADSKAEQSGAGLTQCSPEEFARLHELDRAYNTKFGFPFIIAVKGLDAAVIIACFAARLERGRDLEFDEALAQIARIARFRLEAMLGA
jgi:2-oxo-4-hydroxy-4-carboxy-5-ureidoimidazoline decarboxylase